MDTAGQPGLRRPQPASATSRDRALWHLRGWERAAHRRHRQLLPHRDDDLRGLDHDDVRAYDGAAVDPHPDATGQSGNVPQRTERALHMLCVGTGARRYWATTSGAATSSSIQQAAIIHAADHNYKAISASRLQALRKLAGVFRPSGLPGIHLARVHLILPGDWSTRVRAAAFCASSEEQALGVPSILGVPGMLYG